MQADIILKGEGKLYKVIFNSDKGRNTGIGFELGDEDFLIKKENVPDLQKWCDDQNLILFRF
jgi:hypothetical protein